MTLRFVTATRQSLDDFQRSSPLVKSLVRVSDIVKIELDVTAENRRPLPEVFNATIEAASASDVLVFIHDDVALDDWMNSKRLEEALRPLHRQVERLIFRSHAKGQGAISAKAGIQRVQREITAHRLSPVCRGNAIALLTILSNPAGKWVMATGFFSLSHQSR